MNDRKAKFYMEMAEMVAKQGTCPRAQVGAVVVSDDRVISLGYNGAPRGVHHCDAADGRGCWIERRGKDGSIETCVKAVHAEANAVVNAAYNGACTKGATVFSTHYPCIQCFKLLVNAGISKIIYKEKYDDVNTENMYQIIALNKIVMYKWRPDLDE